MTTTADIDAFRGGVNDLSTLAFREVNNLLSFLGDADPVTIRNSLVQMLPEVIRPYITASGNLAATWYEDLRAAAVGGTFYATASGELNKVRLDALVGYGVQPLFGQSTSTVLSLLGGGVQRMIAGASRDTIYDNVMSDRVRVGFTRIPRAGCCAFCGMLASRGAVYRSESSAGGVVGRGVDASVTRGKVGGQGKGVKARGGRALGENKYHDFCHCVAAPVFAGDTFHQETQAKFNEMYLETGGIVNGATNAKATLASWREVHGTK